MPTLAADRTRRRPASRRLRLVARLLRRLATTRSPVEPEVAALDAVLPPGAVCCDVGAEYGLYTLTLAAQVAPRGRVLSFEPLPGPHAFLRRAVRWLAATTVELHPVALGAADRAATMSLPRRRGLPVHGRAFVADEADGLGPNVEFDAERRLPVQVRTLDGVLAAASVDRVDLVKIDVEGYELAVLRGATEVLERYRPALLVEIEDRHLAKFGASGASVVELLRGHGYRMSRLQDGRWVPAAAVDAATRNYLFTPAP